ncbi:MAG: DUF1080 domain-containing protein [Pseudomonadota bacterium]
MMRILVLAAMLACATVAYAGTSKWRPLFNGSDFSGWRGYKGAPVPTRWRVENGAIALAAEGGAGDLVTAEEFGDFELALEWKVSEGGNSGIIYFIQESADAPYTWSTGPEMQVLDDARHADGKLPSHRAGALYDLIAPAKAAARPVGQWNRARIVVRGGRIEHWLNGVRVVATPYGDEGWGALVAGSKFKAMPHFAKTPRGRIALQDHGDRVWFRNIRIRTF